MDGYCTHDVRREFLRAMKAAAHRINEKHQRRRSCTALLLACHRRGRRGGEDGGEEEEELLDRKFVISETEVRDVDVIVRSDHDERTHVTLTLRSDDCFNRKWFRKSVKIFQRSQVLCNSGIFW